MISSPILAILIKRKVRWMNLFNSISLIDYKVLPKLSFSLQKLSSNQRKRCSYSLNHCFMKCLIHFVDCNEDTIFQRFGS